MNFDNIQPKYVGKTNHLTLMTNKAADTFNLGGTQVKIVLEEEAKRAAVVSRAKLPAAIARELGRKRNVVETVATGIKEGDSRSKIDDHMKSLNVPDNIRKNSQFFFVSTRRRKLSDAEALKSSAIYVTKEHSIAAEEHFILGISAEAKFMFTIIPQKKKTIRVVAMPGLAQAIDGDEDESTPEDPQETPYPADPTHDFGVCYSTCLEDVPDWLLAVVGGVCGSCVTAVGVTVSTGGISTPVLIAICAGCAAAIGIVFGNCLLTCHEMLGT